MTNRDLILELLDSIQPKAYCDDCLSAELAIQPRQQVNQLCRNLEASGTLLRQRGVCAACHKQKITNAVRTVPVSAPISAPSPALAGTAAPRTGEPVRTLDIEHARTAVVRIAHEVWSRRKREQPPHSISILINSLKSENLLPSHQANMMLTLCGLRNAFVYENVPMGQREIDIAVNALAIVEEWWHSQR